jgi:hypothetical protein
MLYSHWVFQCLIAVNFVLKKICFAQLMAADPISTLRVTVT